MMKKQASAVNQACGTTQIISYHQRLRWVTMHIVREYQQRQTEPVADFFTLRFLLNRGMTIIARHVAHATFSDAIDLALAWSEQWPTLSTQQRKAQVLTLTPIAAKLLTRISRAMMRPYPLAMQGWHHAFSEQWGGPSNKYALDDYVTPYSEVKSRKGERHEHITER